MDMEFTKKRIAPNAKETKCFVSVKEKIFLLKQFQPGIPEAEITGMFFLAKPDNIWKISMCIVEGKKQRKKSQLIIFPVHEMEQSVTVRRSAALFGIRGSNDLKNLVPACRKCNLRKGTRMGWWIIKGFLGRMSWYWPMRKMIRIVIFLSIVYIVAIF